MFTPDEKTAEYCGVTLNDFQRNLKGDEDACYCRTLSYRGEDFVPVMACPSQVTMIAHCANYCNPEQNYRGPLTAAGPQ